MFNLLPDHCVVEQFGLFSENLVTVEQFKKVVQQPGVREVFRVKNAVNLVVTSMGDFSDPEDLLRTHLEAAGVNAMLLRDNNHEPYVGNVQYRPYTRMGAVTTEELRAVTLFELPELVSLARAPNKAVVLMARRREYDGRTRSKALRPLLENRDMQLFSHLVIDEATARELLGSA
jgi:DNA-binding transcriptional regulator LsrR (DeoR family)